MFSRLKCIFHLPKSAIFVFFHKKMFCFRTFILYCFMPLVPFSSFVVLLVPLVSPLSFAPVSCYPVRLSVYLNPSGSYAVCQLLSFVECVVILCSLTLSSAPVIPGFCFCDSWVLFLVLGLLFN